MAALAQDRRAFARLAKALEDELGHDLAFAAERAKIAANAEGRARIDLALLEPGLALPLDRAGLDAALGAFNGDLTAAAAETLAQAGVAGTNVAAVVLVGGSSLMDLVSREMQAACPAAILARAAAFTAVVDGLALASGERSN